jgi:HEPN domain-containing protein
VNHLPWIQQAERDLAAAKLLSGSGYHEHAVWFASQSVEKGYKSILVAIGLQYEESHFKKVFGHDTNTVANLLPEALLRPIDPEANMARSNSLLESRANISRYPKPTKEGIWKAPFDSIQDSKKEIADCESILEWCKQRVIRAVAAQQAMEPQ